MRTEELLLAHTYYSKSGEKVRKPRINPKEVIQAFHFLIKSNNGKLKNQLLRLTFTDKAKDFTEVLTNCGEINLINPSKRIRIMDVTGREDYMVTPNIFNSKGSKGKIDIRDNKYIESLLKKLKSGKYDEYSHITKSIEDTLSITTLDDKPIDTTVKYIKGRFYWGNGMRKEDRKRLKIGGKVTTSLDITSSVIQLLLKSHIKGIETDYELQMNIDTIYEFINEKYGLGFKTRSEAKEYIVKQIFCHPMIQDVKLDKNQFFKSIKEFKFDYGYKTMWWVYQRIERNLMTEIYDMMIINKIHFLPVHDEVIFKVEDREKVEDIIRYYSVKFKIK